MEQNQKLINEEFEKEIKMLKKEQEDQNYEINLIKELNAQLITELQKMINKYDEVLKQLQLQSQLENKKKNKNEITQVTKQDQFNGIITSLGHGNASQALQNGSIEIMASSIISASMRYQPRNVLNYFNDEVLFESQGKTDSWLCIDFKTHKVKATKYLLGSHIYRGQYSADPRGWDIEGSNDFEQWYVLDSRRQQECFNGLTSSYIFDIENDTNNDTYYRYFRIIQKEENSDGNNCLAFSAIEFFGDILESSKKKKILMSIIKCKKYLLKIYLHNISQSLKKFKIKVFLKYIQIFYFYISVFQRAMMKII